MGRLKYVIAHCWEGFLFLALALCIILLYAVSCAPVEPLKPDSGAICMTSEMYQQNLDDSFNRGHEEATLENAFRMKDVQLKQFKYADLVAFLKADQCDRCLSSVPGEDAEDSCLDRASCLMNACRSNGFQSYLVVMNFENQTSHAIIAFPTKDKGLIFVEPWLDQIVPAPKVGEQYLNPNNIIKKVGW
jgi:hypothetical protein